MKRFILMITLTLSCGWTSLSFASPASEEKITGERATTFCAMTETAGRFFYPNFGLALGGVAVGAYWAMGYGNGRTIFLNVLKVAAVINHVVQLGVSASYFKRCRDNTAVEETSS